MKLEIPWLTLPARSSYLQVDQGRARVKALGYLNGSGRGCAAYHWFIALLFRKHTPTQIGVTNSTDGLVGISRSPNRGEVIVVIQSFWGNWIRSDPARVDNCLLLENLLTR